VGNVNEVREEVAKGEKYPFDEKGGPSGKG